MIDKKKFQFNKYKNQFLAVLFANIAPITYGLTFAWFSPSLTILTSSDTPLVTGPISVLEIAWLGTAIGIAGVTSVFLSYFIVKNKGLKIGLCFAAAPAMLSWIVILFGNRIEYLYVFRVLSGLSGAAVLYTIPLYVAEIADAEIRGTLGSFLMANVFVGTSMAYGIVPNVSYYTVPYIFLPFSIIFYLTFSFMPDTPHHLIRKGELKKAEKSLRFYKNCADNSDERLKTALMEIKCLIDGEKLKPKIEWIDLLSTEAKLGFLKAFLLSFLYVGTGVYAFLTYAATIFHESGSDFDPNISSVIMALCQLFGSLFAALVMDRIGRRVLLISSTIGNVVGLTGMGIFNCLSVNGYNVNEFPWIPVVSMGLNVICASTGIIPVCYVILAEIFPAKIRSIGMLFFSCFLQLFLCLCTTVFPLFMEILDLYVWFFIFAIISTAGFFFGLFMISDTTGKNLNK